MHLAELAKARRQIALGTARSVFVEHPVDEQPDVTRRHSIQYLNVGTSGINDTPKLPAHFCNKVRREVQLRCTSSIQEKNQSV